MKKKRPGQPEYTRLAPWFGSDAEMIAERVGELIGEREFVSVPFAGGLSVLVYLKARTIVANDLHHLMINLARIVGHPKHGPALIRRLRRFMFHPEELALAQATSRTYLGDLKNGEGVEWWNHTQPNLDAAEAYFTSVWQGRNGKAGTDDEFKGGLSLRWEAGGGDSAKRFRGAIESLRDWQRICNRVTFTCECAFKFMDKLHDNDKHACYIDAPWPEDGDGYRHKFGEYDQKRLADKAASFEKTRVVVRFGDHLLIRKLYPADKWTWHELRGRTASNKVKPEVLLVRN